jgi:HAE1 family hydrophobic/amphiphilic exporter-1
MAAIALFGVLAYQILPVSDLPTVDFPTLTVSAGLPGADAATMASAVASPLERQFTTIAGIDSMTSSSTAGSTSVTMQFALDRNIDSAAVDVQTAISEAMPLMPAGMPAPPSFRKVNPADQPIAIIGLASAQLPMPTVDDYAENLLAPRVSMLNGVAQVTVMGGQKYAVRVQVNPEKLQALHLGINEIDNALRDWNTNLPLGELYGASRTFALRDNGQLMNAHAFSSMVVAHRNGAPVYLRDVANVVDSVEDTRQSMWLWWPNSVGQMVHSKVVGMQVTKQPGTNLIEVADRITALKPLVLKELPPSIHITQAPDKAKNIRQSFKDIQLTMLISLVLVISVIFLFLRNGSATLIPALALPVSILGTFAVMKLLGFSLNNLSLMAIVLSIGFVVDDAIVMLENIVRHMENGAPPFAAALAGSGEIATTIVTMTTSLAAVFIPVLFMNGVIGRLFREFAVTIMSAVLISGIVSLMLTPMLCSRFLRATALHSVAGFRGLLERLLDATRAGYGRSLRFVLAYRPAMMVAVVVVLVLTIRMFTMMPTGFIPDQDDDMLTVILKAAQGTSFEEMQSYTTQVGDMIRTDPTVYGVVMVIGGGGVGSLNTSRVVVALSPRKQRKLSVFQFAQVLRGRLAPFKNFRSFVTIPPAIQLGGRQGNNIYSMVLQSANTNELYAWGDRFAQEAAKLPQLQDVASDVEVKSPRVSLLIDRDKTASLGLDAMQVETALYDAFGPTWSSTIYGDKSQYRVLLEIDPKYQAYADSLKQISFKSANGQMVPLETIVRFKPDVGPQTINHSGQLPAVAVTFGVRPGVSLGEATASMRELAASILPASINTSFEGTAEVFEQSRKNLGVLLFIAIGVVYIVLGMLYESYIHPITILSGLPSAGLGALVMLRLFHAELNVYSFVGLMMLIGLVKKNAIMQVDFALEAERRGLRPLDAVYEGCMIRFRPIMMTTMAALLGAVPIALGFGTGGEARQPLGLAVVGGLLLSQIMTLYLTPVIYTYLSVFSPNARRRVQVVALGTVLEES